jgi:phosphoribosylformylglycinamidine (FGAM) synthase-like enzyme
MEPLEEDIALFSESNGRFVVTVAAADESAFVEKFADLDCRRVGLVTEETRLLIRRAESSLVDEAVDDMRRRFKEGLQGA